MPKRLTIEYVKEFVRDKTNGECEVLSEEYVNSETPLLVRCSCGNTFKRGFNKLRDRKIQCVDCKNKETSENYRANIEDVINFINSTGCEYISGEYENNTSLLTIKCRCGNIFKKSYGKFSQGQDRCPKCGKENSRQAKFKYSVEDVKDKLSEKGFSMIDESEYVDCVNPIRCICKRGHETNIKFLYFLRGQSGCKKCANIEQGGSNHWNYKNGKSDVEEALRGAIYAWKKDVIEAYGNRCAVTKSKSNVIAHHLVDFDTLLAESSNELNIPIHKKIGDYERYEDFISLKERFCEKHTVDIGIALSKSVHQSFHRKYDGIVTQEQFDKFLKEKYNTSLKELQERRTYEQ